MAHLTHAQRTLIENGLKSRESFRTISGKSGQSYRASEREHGEDAKFFHVADAPFPRQRELWNSCKVRTAASTIICPPFGSTRFEKGIAP